MLRRLAPTLLGGGCCRRIVSHGARLKGDWGGRSDGDGARAGARVGDCLWSLNRLHDDFGGDGLDNRLLVSRWRVVHSSGRSVGDGNGASGRGGARRVMSNCDSRSNARFSRSDLVSCKSLSGGGRSQNKKSYAMHFYWEDFEKRV